jgi:hypothetical protein
MKWKGRGRKRFLSNFKVLIRNFSEETEKATKEISQVSLSPDRDLNPGPSEYEAGVLTTRQ